MITKYLIIITLTCQLLACSHAQNKAETTTPDKMTKQHPPAFAQDTAKPIQAAQTPNKIIKQTASIKQPALDSTAKKKVIKPVPNYKAETNDTTYYYYNTGKVSVKITPWQQGKRNLLIFNRQSQLTYQIENVRSSYSVNTELKFKGNGSISEVKTHTNPGASMYWYESTITFSDSNEPEWKNDERFPQNSVTMPGSNASYWDKAKQTWVKQQAME